MITTLQRERRKHFIGASDVPSVLGMSRFKSAYDLWLEKTGKVEGDSAETDSMRLGNALEDAIAVMVERRLGRKLVRPTSMYVAANGFMAANLDRQIERSARGVDAVEIKSTFSVARWGPPGTDEVPDDVMVQAQSQMLCAEHSLTVVTPLFLSRAPELSVYYVRADAELARMIEEACGEFYEKHVLRDIPPEHSLPSADHIARRVRERGKTVVVPDEVAEAFLAARERSKAAEREYEEAARALKAAMQDGEHATGAGASFSFVPVTQSKINISKVQQEYPDIAARCTMSSTYRRLIVKEPSNERSHEG